MIPVLKPEEVGKAVVAGVRANKRLIVITLHAEVNLRAARDLPVARAMAYDFDGVSTQDEGNCVTLGCCAKLPP